MKLKNVLLGLSLLIVPPAMAEPSKGYYTMDAMGCMILQECTEGVNQIFSINGIKSRYPDSNYDLVSNEFNSMVVALNNAGVKVYLAPGKYFPPGHRGVYHTVSNHFYLNERFMKNPGTLMSVMRHEGWHMAQDCMAGDINNTFIAVIFNDEKIPQLWKDMAKDTYPKSALPWEQEAMWTGRMEGMTVDALRACKTGEMWTQYDPTPLTRQFLVDKGYIKE